MTQIVNIQIRNPCNLSRSLPSGIVHSLDTMPPKGPLTEVDRRYLPEAYRKKLPKRIPGIRLGRLAVDQRYQGMRLGELLMMDAISRAQRVHQEARVVGLFVDVLDERAAGFYWHFGFMAAPDNTLMLHLPLTR